MLNKNIVIIYSLLISLVAWDTVHAVASVGIFKFPQTETVNNIAVLRLNNTISVGTFKFPGAVSVEAKAVTPNKTTSVGAFSFLKKEPVTPVVEPVKSKTVKIDERAMVAGVKINYDQNFEIELMSDSLTQASQVTVKELENYQDLPWNQMLISKVYDLKLDKIEVYDVNKPITVKIAYERDNKEFKQLYFYNKTKKTWSAAPTTDYPAEGVVRAMIKDLDTVVAVFSKPGTLTVGKASWYKYKNGDFAASPDFPKGSRLRVTNTANNKSVEVVINDWGPERDKHPDRAIDLDKVAFAKIANTSDGIINVVVQPIKIEADTKGRTLGVKADSLGSKPILVSKSVVILDDANKVILEKNSLKTQPIASLTKVVAVSVFLSLKPDLEKEVTYSSADEQMNYKYCKPGESSKINLKNGARLTIKDLIYATLVGSANNAAEALVRVSGISRDQFIEKMNTQAKSWGAVDSQFVEPSGLSNKNISSAKDYALMMNEAMKNEIISKASVQPSYVFFTADNKRYTVKNTNKLIVEQAQTNLRAEKFPITGSKTGFLNEAGYCLMTKVKQGDKNFTIVALGAPSRDSSFNEMADLINYVKFKEPRL